MTALLAGSLLLALAASPADDGCAAAAAGAEVIAPTLAPELFLRGGFVDVGEATGVGGFAGPTWRLTAGVEVGLAKLLRARAVRGHALAGCKRDGVEAQLRAAMTAGEDLGRAAALRARAAVLERELPEAERIAEAVAVAVKDSRATLDELDAVRLRLDRLRALAAETAAARALAGGEAEESPAASLPALLAAWREADDLEARSRFAVSRAGAVDLSLRGGYDQVFDGRGDLPLFAMATLTWDLGALSSRRAEPRAHAARRQAREAGDGLEHRAEALLVRLRALRAAERARLAELDALRGDLGAQLRVIEAITTAEVRRYRNTLWFELARMDAERAYLEAHTAELDRVLGP